MDDWATRALGDVILKTPTTDPKKTPDVKFLYVDVSGVSNKTLEITTAEELLGKDAPSRARRIVSAGDIIFATVRPTLRRIAIVPEYLDGQVVSTGYFVFKPNSEVFNRYLYYFLQTETFMGKMQRLQAGASYPAVNDTQVKGQPISYPPIPEQQRIVAILDQAFADIEKARANAEQNLKNARELFDSYLQQVFSQRGEGWEVKTLNEIADVQYGYTDKSTEEGDFRYVRITDIDKNGELISENKKYIKHSKEAAHFVVQDKDLLMARTGATFAKVLLYNDYEPSVFASYLIKIKFKGNVKNELYWYFSKTSNYWQQAEELKSGAAQPHFNGAALKQVIFCYPKSLEEQETLIQSFKVLSMETKKLEAIYYGKINALDELKKSLLQKAFSGELTKSKGIAA